MSKGDIMASSSITRRGFIGAAGMAGAGLLALSRPALAEDAGFDEAHDVVVCGCGGAGLTAALILQEMGVDHVLLESEDDVMPSTMLCGGACSLCETPMAPGSADVFYENLLEASGYECQEDLCRAYADNASEMYDKLTEWGVEFTGPYAVPHQTEPFCHQANGGYNIMHPMLETYESRGGEVLTGHRATRLVEDAGGRVVGVVVETSVGEKRLGASKGVILATGDFTRNPELITDFGWKYMDTMVPVSGQGSRGDGLVMGMGAGAATSYITPNIAPSACVGLNTGKPSWLWGLWGDGYSVPCIGMNGRRFHRESDNYVDVLTAALELGDGVFFQLYEQSTRDKLDYPFDLDPEYKGDTIAELGQAVKADYPGFDADALVDEVERYNGFIDAGVDEDWGHTMASTGGDPMRKVENGPFYMMPFHIGSDHFAGGLKIDASDRVVDVFGDVIPGLYAAGAVAGGVSSWSYMTGSMIGRVTCQGMIAARAVAAEA